MPADTPICGPGFFGTDEAQRLTVARLQAQSVPIILLDTDQSYENFRSGFPLVMAHIDQEYQLAGTHVFDERFGINLFVRKDRTPSGTWEPLGWPCYGVKAVEAPPRVDIAPNGGFASTEQYLLAPLRGAGRLERLVGGLSSDQPFKTPGD